MDCRTVVTGAKDGIGHAVVDKLLAVGSNVLGRGLVLAIANARTLANVSVVLCPLSYREVDHVFAQ